MLSVYTSQYSYQKIQCQKQLKQLEYYQHGNDGYDGPEVLLKTRVAIKFIDDDDDNTEYIKIVI